MRFERWFGVAWLPEVLPWKWLPQDLPEYLVESEQAAERAEEEIEEPPETWHEIARGIDGTCTDAYASLTILLRLMPGLGGLSFSLAL
jgi:hypothetical protein